MLIFPEIQIAGGKVVTRTGSESEHVVHDTTPLELLEQYTAQGAERIHVVDVDAAGGGDANNAELVHALLARSQVPLQIAGGMRTVNQIDDWLEAGAASVVLGTLGITDQALLTDVCSRHPGAIIASVATRNGLVMIDGWKTATAFRPEDIVYDLQMAGVAGIIHVDIDRFDGDASASLALTMEIKSNIVIPVYASGTVHSLDDIARIRYLPNIHGVIVGHALVTGAFALSEALEIARQPETSPEPEVETSLAVNGVYSGARIYLAAYSNSPAARWWNHDIREAISAGNPYIEVSIPQEDLAVDTSSMSNREVQSLYESALDEADVVLVALDGIENEAWTGFECGYARAVGKYLLGISAMPVTAGRSRIHDMCDDVIVFESAEDKFALLASIAREVNSRLMSQQADESEPHAALAEFV